METNHTPESSLESKGAEKELVLAILKKHGFNFSQHALEGGYLMNESGVMAAEKACLEVLASYKEKLRKEIFNNYEFMYDSFGNAITVIPRTKVLKLIDPKEKS